MQVMEQMKTNPDANLKHYWKHKLKNIKAHIKANNYNITIPEPLGVIDSDEELEMDAR